MHKRNKLPDPSVLHSLFVFDAQQGKLRWRSDGSIAGWVGKDGYRCLRIDGIHYMAHRIVWKMYKEEDPPHILDHIDFDKDNNRLGNLRALNAGDSAFHVPVRRHNKTRVTGIYWHSSNKWQAYITHRKVNKHLGLFEDIADAMYARRMAEIELYGELHVPA